MRKAYKNYLKREIDDPETQADKKLFIETHFPRQKGIMFRPSYVLVPALSVLLIALGLVLGPRMISDQPMASSYAIHPVDVKRASSRVGNVLVYQKLYQDSPITIVWVFPTSGGTHALP